MSGNMNISQQEQFAVGPKQGMLHQPERGMNAAHHSELYDTSAVLSIRTNTW